MPISNVISIKQIEKSIYCFTNKEIKIFDLSQLLEPRVLVCRSSTLELRAIVSIPERADQLSQDVHFGSELTIARDLQDLPAQHPQPAAAEGPADQRGDPAVLPAGHLPERAGPVLPKGALQHENPAKDG